MVDNERYFVEKYTGDSVGASIGEMYQPSIISLTASSVLIMMEMQGADVANLKLGDFTIGKGARARTSTADKLKEDGMEKLNALSGRFNNYKSLG